MQTSEVTASDVFLDSSRVNQAQTMLIRPYFRELVTNEPFTRSQVDPVEYQLLMYPALSGLNFD